VTTGATGVAVGVAASEAAEGDDEPPSLVAVVVKV
jgi:hypothetical protein